MPKELKIKGAKAAFTENEYIAMLQFCEEHDETLSSLIRKAVKFYIKENTK